ncbi:neural cell adhesion molecule 1-like isoform X7, partial [Paramuricea clavata]
KPKNTTITFTKSTAVVDGNVAVMCNSNGLPEPSYTIIHNDNKVVTKKSTYTIVDVKYSDAGTYKCIASNKLGSDSASRSLTVGKIYLPSGGNSLTFLKAPIVKIKWSLDPVLSTNISRSWSFKSRASGKDEILGKVSRAGDITIVTRLYEVDIEKPATLVLKNVDESYNGVYKFALYPGLPGPSISEVVVFIAKKPNVMINCSSSITVNEGDAGFTCVCRGEGGNPPANITWYKNGEQIGNKSYGENRLTLTNVTKQDIGTYKCVAQSYTLTDEKSIEVK